jgi:hypothetical protein
MNALGDVFRSSGNAFSCAWQVLRYLASFLCLLLLPKAVPAARILAMQSQLAVCKHRVESGKAPAPRFNRALRFLWVILSKLLDKWEDLAQIMRPATVLKWHRTALQLFWRWKSRPGRPPITPEMQALIRRLSTGSREKRNHLRFLAGWPVSGV